MARFERSIRADGRLLAPRPGPAEGEALAACRSRCNVKQPKHSAAFQPWPAAPAAAPAQAMPQRSHWLQRGRLDGPPQQRPPRQQPQQRAQRAEIAAPEPRPIPVQQQRDEEERQDRAAAEKRLVAARRRRGRGRQWYTGSVTVVRCHRFSLPHARIALVDRGGAFFDGPLDAGQAGGGGRAVEEHQRIEDGAPMAAADRHHQHAGQQIVFGALPGRPVIAGLALAAAVEDPAGQGVDRPQRTGPAAEDAAQQQREDHQRQRPEHGHRHAVGRQPGGQEQQRIEEEEQFQQRPGRFAGPQAGRHQQAEKQQQKQRLRQLGARASLRMPGRACS